MYRGTRVGSSPAALALSKDSLYSIRAARNCLLFTYDIAKGINQIPTSFGDAKKQIKRIWKSKK